MVERCRAWHAINAFGQYTRKNDVGRNMTSSPLGSTHSRTTSGVACQHHLWAAHTVERRRAWHACIAFGKYTRSKDVERGMTSPPLDFAHGRTTSGVACHHRLRTAHTVGQTSGMACHYRILGSTDGRATSGVACHYSPWTANTVK